MSDRRGKFLAGLFILWVVVGVAAQLAGLALFEIVAVLIILSLIAGVVLLFSTLFRNRR